MARSVALWAGIACLVAACSAPVAAADRWANPPLTPTCDKQMDGILEQFYGDNSTLAGCNDDCRKQCNEVLHFTFTIMDKQRCFTEDRIRECLVYASDAWTDFVRDCQTFQGSNIAGVTGRRRRRLAAEAEGGSATAVQPSTAGRVGCFPPFTKWQDFEVWLAISDAGAVARNAALKDAAHDEAVRVEKSTDALPKPVRTHHWMAAKPQPACDDRMDDMRKSYYGPNATHAPEDAGACDAACRASCLPLLDDTWSARLSGRTCPARDVLLRCLLVAKADWVDFVKDCETFHINFTPEGAAEGQASVGAAPAAGPAAGFARTPASAEGAAPSPGPGRIAVAGEGFAGAAAPRPSAGRSPGAAEGEGSRHDTSTRQAQAPAPAEGASLAPTASRRLLAHGLSITALDRVVGGRLRRRRRRLAGIAEGAPSPPPAKGEGEGGQAAAPAGNEPAGNDGCFPDFQTWSDFAAWLDGKLVEVAPDHGRASPVGLVSVCVFAGLIGSMAFF